MNYQILFHLFADYFRKHEAAEPRRAKGQHSFVQAPRRYDSCCEDIGIEEEPNSAAVGHF